LANYRLIRYADDFVVMVAGTRAHAASLREEVAVVLAAMGLRLSEAKTRIVHLDEGFDFLVATRGRMVRVGSLNGGLSVMTA
jgi:RNA-directed DNA polymerase